MVPDPRGIASQAGTESVVSESKTVAVQPESPSTGDRPQPNAGMRLVPVLQAVSLAATGYLLWKVSVGPRLLRQPIETVAATALFYAVLAWLWSAAVTFALFLLLPQMRGKERSLHGALRTSAVAVWFAPATILLSGLSPAALAAALALIVTATRLLYSAWLEGREEVVSNAESASGHFQALESAHRTWTLDLATGILAAGVLQCGATAALSHRALAAAALFGLSAAILTLFALSSGAAAAARPRPLPRTCFGIALTILLASGLTVGGIGYRRQRLWPWDAGASGGPAASVREILRELFEEGEDQGSSVPPSEAEVKPLPQPPQPLPPDGTFPGVILWPELRNVTRLVAPVPRSAGRGTAFSRPYTIPFDGEYWIYRNLFRAPPAKSWVHRGSPAALSFTSTDHWPLKMEAHQKLEPPIDLACCRQVRVDIWNADRYPATVSMELLASDAGGSALVSLGTQPVRSVPNLTADPVTAVPETLEFAVPGSIHECGELKVVFIRSRSRDEKSARIAIERFLLVPD